MQSNLDKLFKTDAVAEKEGIDLVLPSEIVFRVRRFGGANSNRVQQAVAKFYKPFAKRVELGTLSTQEQDLIDARIITDACIIGWQGVKDADGKEIAFSFENCVKLLSGLPELMKTITKYASDVDSYKEDLGNS